MLAPCPGQAHRQDMEIRRLDHIQFNMTANTLWGTEQTVITLPRTPSPSLKQRTVYCVGGSPPFWPRRRPGRAVRPYWTRKGRLSSPQGRSASHRRPPWRCAPRAWGRGPAAALSSSMCVALGLPNFHTTAPSLLSSFLKFVARRARCSATQSRALARGTERDPDRIGSQSSQK